MNELLHTMNNVFVVLETKIWENKNKIAMLLHSHKIKKHTFKALTAYLVIDAILAFDIGGLFSYIEDS